MSWTWQEVAALVVVAAALYYLYRRFRPADARPTLVKPRGRLARGIKAAKNQDEEG